MFYIYGAMAIFAMRRKYCRLPYPEIKVKYDGYRWNYLGFMETGRYHRLSVGEQHSGNRGSGGSYSHFVYTFRQFRFRRMMFSGCINACEDILCSGRTEYKDNAVKAERDGYLGRRTDGSLYVKTPAFTMEQKEQFDGIAEKYLAPLMEEYSKAVEDFIKGYKRLFPKHLHEDADRMCEGMFTGFYDVIVGYMQRKGEIPEPPSGSVCDVMVQWKKREVG